MATEHESINRCLSISIVEVEPAAIQESAEPGLSSESQVQKCNSRLPSITLIKNKEKEEVSIEWIDNITMSHSE